MKRIQERNPGWRSLGNQSGVALLITLAMIVLITVVVLSFFIHATSGRQVNSSRANHVEAAILAQSGLDYVTGLFEQEIANPSDSNQTTVSGETLYVPITNANSVPQRLLTPALSHANASFYNLLRQSSSALDTTAGLVPDINASTQSTATAAENGRVVGASLWNEPDLVLNAGFTTTAQLPCWIYVTRTGGLTSTPSADVIGRFAYNVYDIGGLLDINVAGYPSVLSATQIAQLKGSVAGADLTQLDLGGTAAQQAAFQTGVIDPLIELRNPGAVVSGSLNATAYLDLVASSQKKGFLSASFPSVANPSVTYTNLPFVNRQDLLRYARSIDSTSFTAALPYLTQFSRSLNAPSLTPATVNTAATANDNTANNPAFPAMRFTEAATITHFHDTDTTADTYTVKAGDPLIQRRFSLARIAWLTCQGPSADLPTTNLYYNAAGTDAAIQACFGVVWNAAQERWDYYGSKILAAPVLQSAIEPLTTVEDENREPNFFELIKACILDGSLGQSISTFPYLPPMAGSSYPSSSSPSFVKTMEPYFFQGDQDLDSNKDLQILRIGANIINCASPDNYPRIICMMATTTRLGVTQTSPCEVAGVADLPYLYGLDCARLNQGTKDTTAPNGTTGVDINNDLDLVWIPEFFNPHQTSPTTATSGPAAVEVDVPQGALTGLVAVGTESSTKSFNSGVLGNKDLSVLCPAIQLTGATFENYRASPIPLRSHGATDSLSALVPYINTTISTPATLANEGDVVGWDIYSCESPTAGWNADFPASPPGWPAINHDAAFCPAVMLNSLIVRMRYETPGGNWKTYSTLGGNEAFYAATGADGFVPDDSGNTPVVKFSTSYGNSLSTEYVNNLNQMPYLTTGDPLCARFGPSQSRYERSLATPPYATTAAGYAQTTSVNGASLDTFQFRPSCSIGRPVNSAFSGAVAYRPQLSDVTTDVDYSFTEADPDGVRRSNDGCLGSAGVAPNAFGPANPYAHLATAELRPVILHRPYRTVAELGYVFRDVPWKTLQMGGSLDSSTSSSGDAALLDVFSVADEPALIAGRVALNTRQQAVHKALLSGVGDLPDGSTDASPATPPASPIVYNSTIITNLANEYDQYSFVNATGLPSATMPTTVADLMGFMSSNGTTANTALNRSLYPVKNKREAIMRALGDASQTRTWNVLVDEVAQTGKFEGTTFGAGTFVVEGETHLWLSEAIDRYTGHVVDSQLETVNE